MFVYIKHPMFQKCPHVGVFDIIPLRAVEEFIYILTYIVMRRNVWTVSSPGALTKVSIAVNRYMDRYMDTQLFNGKINFPSYLFIHFKVIQGQIL